jgi:peptidoglycan/xylan/chitin deacetylase (PgdA/CDA1 family)
METHLERAQQLIADPLFEIGSHGLRHLDMSHAKEQTLGEEITLTAAATPAPARRSRRANVSPARCSNHQSGSRCFVPYGRCNDKALAATADAGLIAVQWDLVISDPDPRVSPKTIANTILSKAHPGAIVVAHCQWRGRKSRGTRHRAAEAEGAGLWFRHGQRAAQGRQASDRGALLSEQPRRHDTRGQDLRSARQL